MKMRRGPILEGPAGTATRLLVDGPLDRPDQAATIATWWLECPGQSPAWNSYLLSAVHLRPLDGVRPAAIGTPGVTHEVLLLALDPTKEPRPENTETWGFLRPFNLVYQLELPSDEEAAGLLEQCARAVVDGILWAEPPLAGQVEPWRTVLLKTAAHARGEPHAP